MDTESKEFKDLLLACRRGDIERVDQLVSLGINLNQVDKWDYSPLFLASLCGHIEVVQFLLERGAVCDRDTFEGERCVYGALNDSIRDLLLSYDITKSVDVNQPFAAHMASLVPDAKVDTADVVIQNHKLHRFLLIARLHTTNIPVVSAETLACIVNYVYQKQQVGLEKVDLRELIKVTSDLGLVEFAQNLQKYKASTTPIARAKIMRSLVLDTSQIAQRDMIKFVDDHVFPNAIASQNELTASQKLAMIQSSAFPDVILQVDNADDGYWYVPSHRAILVRSEYFETMFSSSFSEAAVYRELMTDGVVDRQLLESDPEQIPVIPVSAAHSPELLRILLEFLYYDKSTFEYFQSVDVLFMADSLLIDRLKNMAAVVMTSDGYKPRLPIYSILRAGWETRINRLEVYSAQVIAHNLREYIDDPQFEEVVLESAERIQDRQDTDTIDLIDDIRFYLAKKFHITNYDGYDFFFKDVVGDDPISAMEYEKQLGWIDDLLARLGLDA